MRSAVIVFPGSNCDRDAKTVLEAITGKTPAMVWHAEPSLPRGTELVVLPGGFSYGDYLRSGAMAARSPIMQDVKKYANRGGRVLGICNGFQILTEAGLLPGTLLRNAGLKFICREVYLRVESNAAPFTQHFRPKEVITLPVAHHDGNYFTDAATLQEMEALDQIAFRYCTESGDPAPHANPNGSLSNIAGVFNARKNVLGMMPHPERHAEYLTGGTLGAALFTALLAA